jgi:hypothetical protein
MLSDLTDGIVGEARIIAIVALPVLILVIAALAKYLMGGR